MNIFKQIISFILPPRCACCGKVLSEDKGLCDDCINQIEFINGTICHCCGQPLMSGVKVMNTSSLLCGRCLKSKRHIFRMSRSACVYDDISKRLILDFKFYDRTDLASLLAKMLFVAGQEIFKTGVDVIVPIPLHYTRLLHRRYNQSALLAKELGRLSGIKVEYDAVIKHKRTRPQVECDGLERLKNVKDAFSLKNTEALQGKRVLLIDDVLTTGTTLKECALAIRKAKPKSIDALTIARAL